MSNAPRSRPRSGPAGQTRSIPVAAVLVGIGLAVVVLVGVLIALARDGGDDDGAGGGGTGADAPAFGLVSVEGDELPSFERSAGDDATGLPAPVVELETPEGETEAVGGAGSPALVVFLAHWCPHCQAEVPVLVDLAEDGAFEGIRLIGVLTGTNRDAPNFPPVAWLEREGWPGEVLLDDERTSAAEAFGLAGYPFMVALDAEGEVVARASGEQAPEVVQAMVDAARGASGP